MTVNTEYKVYVGDMEWGTRDSLELAEDLYLDAKLNNSDCFVSLVKVSKDYIKEEFIEYDPFK